MEDTTMLEVKVTGKRKRKVHLTMSDGDYRLFRLVMEDSSHTHPNSNIRDYLNHVVLPLLPA